MAVIILFEEGSSNKKGFVKITSCTVFPRIKAHALISECNEPVRLYPGIVAHVPIH